MDPNPYQPPSETGPPPGRWKLPALSTGTWFGVAVAGFLLLTVVLNLAAGVIERLFP